MGAARELDGLARQLPERQDTRVWVPRRNPALGWTLNYAHRVAWWSTLGLFTVPIGLVLLLLLWWAFG